MDKISIIIPAYNSEQYIKETIESLLSQTFKNIEIIIINDGSVDNTEEVVNSINSKKIKYYKQKNAGQSSARNTGLKYATGNYIAFMDSDDILNKDCLEKLLKEIKKNDSDVSICGYEKFYDNTNEVFYKRIPRDWEVEFDNGNKHVFIYSPWAKLYKTDFIKKYNIRFSEGEQLEDGPYSCLVNLLANNIATVNYVGLRYRVYNNSTMGLIRKKNSKPNPPYNGVRTLINDFNKYNMDPSKKEMMEYCTVKILAGFVTNMFKNVDKKSRKQICIYCHEMMNEYFKDIKKNKYIKINKIKKLPLSHRVAIRLFILFNNMNLLYPFSLIVSRFL